MRRLAAGVLRTASCALLALCVGLLLLAAALLSSQVAVALHVAPLALAVTRALPAPLSFWGVLASPLGGVFRTDFVLVALAAFVAAKILRKIARAVS